MRLDLEYGTFLSQSSVPHISSYRKEDFSNFGDDSVRYGIALNVLAGARKMGSACLKVNFSLSLQTCDFAHLPFTNLACAALSL